MKVKTKKRIMAAFLVAGVGLCSVAAIFSNMKVMGIGVVCLLGGMVGPTFYGRCPYCKGQLPLSYPDKYLKKCPYCGRDLD